jgi:hypothetical protein
MMCSSPTNVPAALRRNVRHSPLEHFEQRLLDPLARDIAGDRNVVRRLADLVDFVDIDDSALSGLEVEVGGVQQLEQDILDVLAHVAGLGQGRRIADGKRHIQDTGERPGQQGLATPGRPDEQDIRFVELDLGLGLFPVHEPFVMVMDGHREDLFGALLADDVRVELFLDFPWCGNVGE